MNEIVLISLIAIAPCIRASRSWIVRVRWQNITDAHFDSEYSRCVNNSTLLSHFPLPHQRQWTSTWAYRLIVDLFLVSACPYDERTEDRNICCYIRVSAVAPETLLNEDCWLTELPKLCRSQCRLSHKWVSISDYDLKPACQLILII